MSNIWDDTGPMNDEEKSVVVTSKMMQEKFANLETIHVEPLKQQQRANRRMETPIIIKRPTIEGTHLGRDIYLLGSRFKGDLVPLLKCWGFLLE